jgi:hypothetical protein
MNKQCECCANPLGENIVWRGTRRVICNGCLGFIARWVAEVNEGVVKALPEPPATQRPTPQPEVAR